MNDFFIDLDGTVEDADWPKRTWDLPPYRSVEFFRVIPFERLDHFRTTPVYRHAVESGLIHEDEWVGEFGAVP